MLIQTVGFGRSSASLLLDTYTGAAVAFSLRKLRTAYSGSAIRVRESDGDTEADIGFDGSGDLDTTALLSHVGANSGFIVKWYDQSGNANDWTNSTASEQPRIVSSGTIDTLNSLPAIFHQPGATTNYLQATISGLSTVTAFEVVMCNRNCVLATEGDGSSFYLVGENGSGSTQLSANAGTPTYHLNGSAQSPSTRDNVFDTFFTGAQVLISTINLDFTTWASIRSDYPGATYSPANYMQERIWFDGDQSSNRSAIDTNINSYWSIF